MTHQEEAEKLRIGAEARLKEAHPSAEVSDANLPRLVHELQVHQIELEMQNAALAQAREDLEASRDRYLDLYEFAPVGYITLSHEGKISEINLTGAALLREERRKILNQPFTTFVADACQAGWWQDFQQALGASWQQNFELVMLRADGAEFDAHLDYLPMVADGAPTQLRIALTDISARKQNDKQLQLAASVFTHAREGIMITTADAVIIDVNQAFSDITGYVREEVIGQNPRILSSGRQDKAFFDALWQSLIATGMWSGELWNRRKNGEIFAEMLIISAVRDAHGDTQQYVALLTDISEQKQHQLELEHIAHFDILTGLPNRVLLSDRMHQAMVQTERNGLNMAVTFLDLDGFKAINDLHGHEVGDLLLTTLASRMKRTLREGDSLARLGGDEFVAVMPELPDIETSMPMLNRLLAAAALPVQIGELHLQVSASAGVTFYPQAEEVDADQLLRQADHAMYQAKLAGKNRYHVFDAGLDLALHSHHKNLERIRAALAAREFVLYYQPKVNMRTGQVIGVEALIRWQHPQHGILLPAAFLPLIEAHPLAIEINQWVIDHALYQIEVWQAAGFDIAVSVNLGARELHQIDFVERLRALLAAHPGVKPGSLELEVLESSAPEYLALVANTVDACRKIGVSFALDDFGSGHSTLSNLKDLSVAQLKIDQRFVQNMLDAPEDLALLEGVLGLATAFHRQAIAEGVENVKHGELLLRLGCELAQGFFIARPMPADKVPAWASTWQTDASWLGVSSLSSDETPMLYAEVEHRTWIAEIEHRLNNDQAAQPEMEQHLCRFGAWLDNEGRAGQETRATFLVIDALHRQLHELGAELLRLQTLGRAPEALARLPGLHSLLEALLEKLHTRLLEGDGRRNKRSGLLAM